MTHISVRTFSALTAGLTALTALSPRTPALADSVPAPVAEVRAPSVCDPTGATDVTDCLNEFLAAVPAGSTVNLPARATYRVEGTLTLLGKSRIVLNGHGAMIFATTTGDRGRAHVSIRSSSDITIRHLKIRGPNEHAGPQGRYRADLEAQAGVDIRGSARVALRTLDITDVWGDFVYVSKVIDAHNGTGPRFIPSYDVSITDSHFDGAARQGVAVTNAHRVLIEGNKIFNARRSIIDLEPPSGADSVSDVTISRNLVTPGRFNFVSAATGGGVSTVAITDNVGRGKALTVVIRDKNGTGRSNFYVARNVSNEGFGSLNKGVLLASNAKNVVYEDNVQPIQSRRKMYGMWAENGTCGASSAGNVLLDERSGEARPQMGGSTTPCPAGTPSGPPALPGAPAVG